jgi:plasmid stability protein
VANLTIVVDDETLQKARIRAVRQRTSVNAVLRDYLEAFAGGNDAATGLANFLTLASSASAGIPPSHGRTWTRDEVHDRADRTGG